MENMRLLSLVVVLGIIYYAYSRRITPGPNSVDTAMTEFSKTAPATASSSPSSSSTSQPAPQGNLRRPIDRTRAVLDQVKQRNGSGDF